MTFQRTDRVKFCEVCHLDWKIDFSWKAISEVDTWWTPFKNFITEKKNTSVGQINSTLMFQSLLSDFLFDVSNAKQQFNFKFNGSLHCGKATPHIRATQMKLQYGMSSSLPPPSEHLPAKATVDRIIEEANISSKSFATSPVSWSFGRVSKIFP